MKPVNFFRNAWRKLEQKTSSDTRPDHRKESHKRSSPTTKQSLTITVNHLPLQDTTVANIDGTWRTYHPPSPIYDQFAQHRCSSRADSESSARAQGPSPRKLDSPTPKRYGTLRASSSPYASQTGSLSSTNVVWPKKAEPRPSPASKHAFPASQPSYNSCELLPPLDLAEDLENRLDLFLRREGCDSRPCISQSSKRYSDSQRRGLAIHAPRNRIGSMSNTSTTGTSHAQRQTSRHHRSPASVQTVLDLSFHAREGSLYHKSSSTPHLLCSSTSDVSADGSSDIENFPLSLFPPPPPLVVPKKVPAPLVIKSTPSQSSLDSTPLSTPTTPRFYTAGGTPSQPNAVNSPSKKVSFARSASHYSPPPFSPPTTPLPATPSPVAPPNPNSGASHGSSERPRPSLRNTRSNIHLRMDAPLPFPAMHRLTASEPITNRLPSRPPPHRPAKLRSEPLQARNLQRGYVEQKDRIPRSASEAPVEWGYAL